MNNYTSSPFYFLRAWIIFALIVVTGQAGFAQTCTIQVSDTGICAGSTVNFSVNISGGGTPSSYAWDFGDGFTSASSVPNHIFITPGVYTPTVTVNFSGGGSCTATGHKITVFALPITKYTITTTDTMCYKNNQLCILDQSVPGASNAPLKRRLFQLNNGYFQSEDAPYSNTLCYQNSINFFGLLYDMVLEVTDTNNCSNRLQKADSVLLLPRRQPVDFIPSYTPSCFTTNVNFTNTSAFPATTVDKFYWDFGDGLIDSTHWQTISHLYTSGGTYIPKLFVRDNNGCWDTAVAATAVKNIVPDSTVYIYSNNKVCYKENHFSFISKNNDGTTFWTVYDKDNSILYTGVTISSVDSFVIRPYPENTFLTCGLYRVNMLIQFPDCMVNVDTFVTVYGPKAIIQNDTSKVVNRDQCEVWDTVYFITPVPYLSCQFGNTTMQHLWNFDDPFAPTCTTDTKNGINVGMNCNFSKDSLRVKHHYTPGKDRCYFPSLYMKDPVHGCDDVDTISLGLTAPSAHPDTTVIPNRRGLYFNGITCLNSPITFKMDETLPECGYEKAWINIDSACGKDNWILADTLDVEFFEYIYGSTCDSNGYVTVGLIIRNGLDKNGNPCYDTAWYHNMFRMLPITPYIYGDMVLSCKPYTVTFHPFDSIQYRILNVRWDFNADTASLHDTVWQYLASNDSVIHSQTHVFPYSGVYHVSASFLNQDSCSRIDVIGFAFGYKADFTTFKSVNCLGDSVLLFDFVRYYDAGAFDNLNPRTYWQEPARAAANKEKIWWDIGDGKGFVYTGPNPIVKYDQPGKYTVTMVVQDSIGCTDTIVKEDYITIIEPIANIRTLQNTYYCAPQIVLFNDSSFVMDDTASTVPSTMDSVVNWTWDFGDLTAQSILKDPAHNYTSNGVFNVTMFVVTASGCKDSASIQIDMKGPKPLFIIQDTMGCEPFTTMFVNTTGKQLQSWTWYFGDPSNQTFFTTKDTNISFTYLNAGVYDVKLLGIEDVFNPGTGNTTTCFSFFPDTVTKFPDRKVYVLPTPQISIQSKDSICPNQEVDFTVAADSVYSRFHWAFGDGSFDSIARPDTVISHIFLNSGVYTVSVIPVNSSGFNCIDTAAKVITASVVEAGFDIDATLAPQYTFTNTSQHAVRYVWDFGKPSAGAANQVTTTDASFGYGTDTGIFTICLMAFNADDCWDSICKQTKPDARITIPNVFTPDNNDNKNDAFDIDVIGYTKYELQIYNRWGAEVFKGSKDGVGNDGVNWNGKNHNDGALCPAGVYYFIFTYKLITEEKEKTVHGTITLIRDK